MRYIKVFFQKIVSSKTNDYWWAYSQQPSFSCVAKSGKLSSSFNVTMRTSATKVSEPLTLWLGDMTDEEAQLWKEEFGASCYLAVDADNNMTLAKDLPKGESVVTSLTA